MDWRSALQEGVYPVAFAAKIADATPGTVASWFRPTGKRLPPAIITPFKQQEGRLLIPFLALVEARFISRFRRHGLSLQTIRKVARKLRTDHNSQHPFADERFRTDGKRVMREEAADNERHLIDVMTDAYSFPSIIEPSLFDTVVYIDDIAARLKPFDDLPMVFIDPKFSLGRPIVTNGNVPTDTLSAAFLAEGDAEGIADWYGTSADAVMQAVAFEQRLAA